MAQWHRQQWTSTLMLSMGLWLVLLQFELIAGLFEARAETRGSIQSILPGGVPADAPISIEMNGRRFRIPAGYLMPWPAAKLVRQTSRLDYVGFAFWMPEKRWVEREPFLLADFRPVEKGRPQPDPASFVVFVRRFEAVDPSNLNGYVSPERQYENLTENSTRPSPYTSQFQSDLELIELVGPPEQSITYYTHPAGVAPQLLLHCTREGAGVPNPYCSANVYFSTDEVAFNLQFPRGALQQWREIVQSTRDLIHSWRVD